MRVYTVMLVGGKEVRYITDSSLSDTQVKKLVENTLNGKDRINDIFHADVEHGKRYIYLDADVLYWKDVKNRGGKKHGVQK